MNDPSNFYAGLVADLYEPLADSGIIQVFARVATWHADELIHFFNLGKLPRSLPLYRVLDCCAMAWLSLVESHLCPGSRLKK